MEEHEHTAECVHGHERAPAPVKQPKKIQPGLLDRIEAAKTQEEVNALLAEGAGPAYANASGKIRRKWQKAAEARIAAITAGM